MHAKKEKKNRGGGVRACKRLACVVSVQLLGQPVVDAISGIGGKERVRVGITADR